ncbi:MAG: D-threonine aldolase [Planctomycetaceae bacterium]|nr:D-threonine aldolase [Planctomycetaceae bacterium]
MDPRYHVADTSEIISPALLIFREQLEANLQHVLKIAKDPARLRPHCKTHKMREVIALELSQGIVKHKCATLAEAEMLANCGVRDIFLAYNIVGPNIRRVVSFCQRFPDIRLGVTADHLVPLAQLGNAASDAGISVDVLLDIDTGQHRTGITVGSQARILYSQISRTPGLKPGGFHVYDGHQHQKSLDERRTAVLREFEKVLAFRDEIVHAGLPVPKLVCGGTASFPIYAELTDPSIEFSPGTCVFNDAGYSEAFPDLVFQPAAVLLTRVISRPTPDRVTFDLGYKAVASDPPAGKRLTLPEIPDAEQVLQNEEHLVIQTAHADEFQPGDETYAIPRHICPTSALHKEAYVIVDGKLVERWQVVARDRCLTL